MAFDWQDDPYAFNDPLGGTDFERADVGSSTGRGARVEGRRHVLLLSGASIVAVVAALVLGWFGTPWIARGTTWIAVLVVGIGAYFLAVASELRVRRMRRRQRRHDRPLLAALLRLAVFWAAVASAYLAAAYSNAP